MDWDLIAADDYLTGESQKQEVKNEIKELKEKLKKNLLKTVSDINNYDTEDLTSPHYDMNLSPEQLCKIDNYICKIIDYAAKLASGIVDDIYEY